MDRRKLTRRAFLLELAGFAAAAFAAGCGATATPTAAPTQTPVKVEVTRVVTQQVQVPVTQIVEKPVTQIVQSVVTATPVPPTPVPPTPAPKVGGTLIVPIGADPPSIDPCNPSNLGSGLWSIPSLIYDGWWRFDQTSKRVPYVFSDVKRADGSDTLVYTIKPGIKFHGSGREFTAADAVWSYQRYIDPNLGCSGAKDTISKDIVSMTATDKYTLTVKVSNPQMWTYRVWLPPILDKDVVTKSAVKGLLGQAEAGTGPWMLKEWVPQSYISFVRNPDYWDKPPLINEFRMVVMPEARAQVAAMKAGQINFLRFSDYQTFDQLNGDPNTTIFTYSTGGYQRLNVNHFRPAMQDPNVLQALRYGINRQQLVDTLTRGKGTVSGPVAPAAVGYALPQAELMDLQKYDPKLAMEYLAKSGYDPKTKRLALVGLSISGFQSFTDNMLIVQANLKDIGIDMELRVQEVGVWVDQRLTKKEYDLSGNDYGTDLVDPILDAFRSDRDEQKWTGGGDPELDKLIDAFTAEPDATKRMTISQNMQRLMITKVREIYLYAPPTFDAVSNKIVGYKPWATVDPGNYRGFDWEQAWIKP
jgi:peptide/nickel transport system substrate-binding protein